MLLNNPWFGPSLKQWEDSKTLSRQTKYKASLLIVISFIITIAIFNGETRMQVLLITMALVLLFFVWRIKENPATTKNTDSFKR